MKSAVEKKKVKVLFNAKMAVKALNEATNPNTTWLCQSIHSAASLSSVLQTLVMKIICIRHCHCFCPVSKINIQMELTLNAAINSSDYSGIY